MRANGALSELHIVPLDQQRCYSVGDPRDPTVPVADRRFQRFCSNRSLTSINHTMGFSSMEERGKEGQTALYYASVVSAALGC